VVLTMVVCILLITLRCTPPKLVWHFELAEDAKETCLDESAVLHTTSGISLLTDLLVLVLPIKTISGMI